MPYVTVWIFLSKLLHVYLHKRNRQQNVLLNVKENVIDTDSHFLYVNGEFKVVNFYFDLNGSINTQHCNISPTGNLYTAIKEHLPFPKDI